MDAWDAWGVFGVAVASAAALIVTAMATGFRDIIVAWTKKIINSVKRSNYLGRIRRMQKFLHLFETLRIIEEVQRCVIFTGHNCGGMPSAGKAYTVQCLDGWSVKPGKTDPAKTYNFSMRVDAHHTHMLQIMIEKGFVVKEVKDMPNDATLRAYYESEGVKFTNLYYLGILDDELIYLSVGSYDIDKFSRITEIELQLAVDRMRSLIAGEDV